MYSHFCTSCALQSFMSTYPNILPHASSDAIGLPIAFVAFAFVVAPSVVVAGGSYGAERGDDGARRQTTADDDMQTLYRSGSYLCMYVECTGNSEMAGRGF